jgi:hypothetical protein
MIIRIRLGMFYSSGDERRLFEGLEAISGLREIRGEGRDLILDIQINALGKEDMRELLALLWRYGISLAPLRPISERKKFRWLIDEEKYWYSDMFSERLADTLPNRL